MCIKKVSNDAHARPGREQILTLTLTLTLAVYHALFVYTYGRPTAVCIVTMATVLAAGIITSKSRVQAAWILVHTPYNPGCRDYARKSDPGCRDSCSHTLQSWLPGL